LTPVFSVFSGQADHVGRHVNAYHAAGIADLSGCQEAINAAAAAKVDNCLARLIEANATGFPQPSPILAPSGTLSISSLLYPYDFRMASAEKVVS